MQQQPQPEQLSDADTRRETQKLLLSGKWRMLGESCPITLHPLFLNKETGVVWSVKLQMPVNSSSSATFNTTPPNTTAIAKEDAAAAAPSLSSNEISARIGQKLLLGWELLNETGQDGVPLMRDLSGKVWSPSSEEEEEVAAAADAPPPPAAHHHDAAYHEEDADEEEDREAVSQRIGQKLLLGWTMLAESCPVTQACPLFLDPTSGRKWSAALNAYLKTDEDEKKKKKEEPNAKAAKLLEDEDEPAAVPAAQNNELNEVKRILTSKLLELARQMARTQDVAAITALATCMQHITSTLQQISSTRM